MIVIPVADQTQQNFDQLIDDLTGNYVFQEEDFFNNNFNENVQEVVINPYLNLKSPDYSQKIFFVSHEEYVCPPSCENIVVSGDLSVSKLWNAGISKASERGATHIVILNEVSSINPHIFLEAVSECEKTIINLSDGGCFIVKPGVVANESYRWWFADLDLFLNNEVDIVRNDFTNIRQENRILIEGYVQKLVDQDRDIFNR